MTQYILNLLNKSILNGKQVSYYLVDLCVDTNDVSVLVLTRSPTILDPRLGGRLGITKMASTGCFPTGQGSLDLIPSARL